MNNVDQSLSKFEKYLESYEELLRLDLSESDTRSKVIDKIFIDVLNWQEHDIKREGHGDHGFFDYKLSLPGLHFVIEAKKQFISFFLPSKHKTATIKTLLKGNQEVITQIRNYATDSGISYGVITNGKQFILGQFSNNDGTDWKENKCLLFHSHEDIKDRFIEFFNNLERQSVIENGGFQFNRTEVTKDYNKIIATLSEQDDELIRNNLSVRLTPILDKIFGEIFVDDVEDDEEFIRECFVETQETKKNREEIERLFEDKAPNLAKVNPTRNTNNLASEISKEMESYEISIKESRPPKPIIIVGSKGAGKTTFINFLFKKKLDQEVLKKFPNVHIDFRKYFDHEKSFDTKTITKDIVNNLYEKYPDLELHSSTALKRIYFKEIKLQDESIWSEFKKSDKDSYNRKLSEFLEERLKDSYSHLEMLSKYLIRDHRVRLIIVIDNADQFDHKIQEDVFLFANSLNARAHCGIFVSLREGYYYKWKNSPPFDAFESNVYHVTAPRYSDILQKRITYTLAKIDEKFTGFTNGNEVIQQEFQKVVEFLSSIKSSVFENSNSEILDFLQATTLPNIREGLRVFKTFLTSGHTNVQEYIERELFKIAEKKISIPLHEFIKAVALNNKLYYNHEHSLLKNIFYPVAGSSDHFLKCRLLKYLHIRFMSVGSSNKSERYSKMLQEFVDLGYNLLLVEKEIVELMKFGLIESETVMSDTEWEKLPSEDFNLAISAKGYYYYLHLKNRFHYLDLIVQDIPIFDDKFFSELVLLFPKPNEHGKRFVHDRKNLIEKFMSYLKKQEAKQSKEVLTRFGSVVDEIFENGLNRDLKQLDVHIATQKQTKLKLDK